MLRILLLLKHNEKSKKIFYSDNSKNAKDINPYLTDAPNIIVTSRSQPICDVSEMVYGNKPTDGGNLLLNEEEKEDLIEKEPLSKKWVRPFIGAREFLNGEKRWCLWLVDANPSELRKCKLVIERIKKVKEFRLDSKKSATRKLANIPTLFGEIRQPNSNYFLIPKITSENRKYIPIGFMSKDVIAGDSTQIIPNATVYEFGVLSFKIHMLWVRVVAGRLKSDYRYSSSLVYNNFIWSKSTPQQKENIEKAAQEVLDTRKLYPDSTLADLL